MGARNVNYTWYKFHPHVYVNCTSAMYGNKWRPAKWESKVLFLQSQSQVIASCILAEAGRGVGGLHSGKKWLQVCPAGEKAMATHSSTLAWKIPWMEEHGRLQSMGSLRVRHDCATSLSFFTFMRWRRKWQPTPVFSPGESQGCGRLVGCRPWGRTKLAAAAACPAGGCWHREAGSRYPEAGLPVWLFRGAYLAFSGQF